MLTTPELIREATQRSRLGKVLPAWLDRVPLYQSPAYAPRELRTQLSADALLGRLPLITKADLRREFPHNFLSADADLDSLVEKNLLEVEHTSGTAEERTPLLLARGWWPAQEELALRRNQFVADILDANPEARRVTINSPVCGGDICYTVLPSRAERTLGNNLFVSLSRFPFLWDEAELERIVAEVAEWKPIFLDVDPVYGVIFARFCERRGIRLPSLRFILCSYEFVSVVHRRVLNRVFGVPVFNLYGTTETGHLLMENETGEMVPSLETAFLEVVNTDTQGIGQLVATTLTNDYMPLIRYRVGDLVEQRAEPYRTTYVVHGREHDAFHTPKGRVTPWQIDECFSDVGGFLHYQLLEETDAPWQLRYAPDGDGPSANDLEKLRERLTQKLGLENGIEFQATDLLLAEGSGKFRLGYPRQKT
ncbi:MAG TPA: hypothetical protein VH413_01800 [Verrucomicrobiae bacterium]|jgi:phenylacetate-CoA ligase|nr:hypothetical protein [Verrucomicrobiae bacterium]